MLLKGAHKEWRLEQISVIDVRAVELEQLLTFLWLRVKHDNRPVVRLSGSQRITVADLAAQMEGNELFRGFRDLPGASEAWLRADLVFTRKKDPDAFTVARPVHLDAARVRNPKENNDSFASRQVYSWIRHADAALLDELLAFIEPSTDETLDLPSLALRLLGEDQPADTPKSPDPDVEPLCWRQAVMYAEDLRAVLAYRRVLPRASIVDHIRRITGLHLGLHFLRMFRIVVAIEGSGGEWRCSTCDARERAGRCAQPVELVVDCGEDANSQIAQYAEAAWAREEEWIARYVRSHLALKKLDQFAHYEEKERNLSYPHTTLAEIAGLEKQAKASELERYFDIQLADLRNNLEDDTAKEAITELEHRHRRMGFNAFRTYHAVLCQYAERRWTSYNRWLLDSLLGKNASDGLLRQPLGGRRRRRAVLSPSLLETLVLISAVRFEAGGVRTAPLRVDQLIDRFRDRYGFLIAHAPALDAEDPAAIRVLADNAQRFRARLRETGVFTDQSDAYLAQTVRPRVRL